MPSASIKQLLVNITYNTFRLCRVRFYTFVGHPFLKQLYMRSLVQQGSNLSNFARPISMTRNYDTLSSVCVLPTNINSCSFWRNVQENDHAMFKFVDHKICGIDLVCSSTAYCQITSIKLLTHKVTVKHFICTHNVFSSVKIKENNVLMKNQRKCPSEYN